MADMADMADMAPVGAQAGWTPVPDPTRLTTDAVNLATTQMRRELATLREILEARLNAMDKAIQVAADELAKGPGRSETARLDLRSDFARQMTAEREFILSQIENVSAVAVEKFEAVNTRFLERDTRTEQAAQESRISLDAALAAAKEAVSEQNKANAQAIQKSEVATQKQIDAMVTLMRTSNDSLVDKIDDIKTRLDRGDTGGYGQGVNNARVEYRDETRTHAATVGQWIAAASAFIALGAIIVAVILH
jgi:hypothetical protein